MYRQVFSNRWIALLFVLMTAAGAASLVGTEETDGALDRAAEQLHSQQAEFDQAVEELDKAEKQNENAGEQQIEFTSDEELIDTAEGLDASGVDPSPEPSEVFDPQPDHTPDPLVEPVEDGIVFDDGAG